jgi:hypothetical protein
MEIDEDRCWCGRKMNENKTHYKCPKCNTITWKDTSKEGTPGDLTKQTPTPLHHQLLNNVLSFTTSPEGIRFIVYIMVGVFLGWLFGVMFTEARIEGF